MHAGQTWVLCGMGTHSGTICPSSYGSPVRRQVLRDVTQHFNWPLGNLTGFEHRRVIYQKHWVSQSTWHSLLKARTWVHVTQTSTTCGSGYLQWQLADGGTVCRRRPLFSLFCCSTQTETIAQQSKRMNTATEVKHSVNTEHSNRYTVNIENSATVNFRHVTILQVSAAIYFRHGLQGNTGAGFGYKFSAAI